MIILLYNPTEWKTEHYSDMATLLSKCEDVYSADVPTAMQVSIFPPIKSFPAILLSIISEGTIILISLVLLYRLTVLISVIITSVVNVVSTLFIDIGNIYFFLDRVADMSG